MHPEDWPRVAASLQAALAPTGDGLFAEEFRLVHSDGRVVWDGIEFDITARKTAEQVAQQSARELQMIFDHAPVGIALLKDRKFVRVNECQAAMLGYTPEEFAGQSARFIYPSQEDYEKIGGAIYEEITRDGQSVRETTFRCKNGSLVHLHLRVVPADRRDPRDQHLHRGRDGL